MSSGLSLGLEWNYIDSAVTLEELSYTVQTPPANNVRVYAKDSSGTSTLCYKNDAGTEICLPTSGSFVTGTGVLNRVALWTGVNTIGSDADLTFVTDTLTSTKVVVPTSATFSFLTAGSIPFAGAAGLLSQDNANLFWDDASNFLGLGTAVPGFQFHGVAPDASSFNFTLETYGTGPTPNYRGRAARGTKASPSQLVADDLILALSGLPYNSSPGFAGGSRAQITFASAEAQTSTAQGTYIELKTTPTGSATQATRFRVGPSGQWGIGGATFGGSGDIFSSGGASAAPTWVTRATLNAALDHGTLAGLGDDDHTQYALLAGRSGGQTLIGGTASGNNLVLQSTSHATKGLIAVPSVWNIAESTGKIAQTATVASGPGYSLTHVQTAPNTGDTSDGTFAANYILTASSATNELVSRGFSFVVTNNLTGGGAIQNMRSFNLAMNDNSSTLTTALDGIYIERGTASGTTTTIRGIVVNNMGAAGTTTAIGLYIAAQSGATNNFTFSLPVVAINSGTTVWTAGVPNANPSGLVKMKDDSGNTRYIPCWA